MQALLVGLLAISQMASAYTWLSSEQQEPFFDSFTHEQKHYEFTGPVRNVAIIGAGVSGLVAYRELTREGFNVKLFDRDEVPGGTWHYSDRIPLRAHYSNVSIERAEYTPDLPPVDVELPYEDVYENNPTHGPTLEDRLREHRAQKAVWESLHSNAPSPVQQISELPWPKATEWELPNSVLGRYLRAFASWHGVNANDENPNVSYNTRLEDMRKITTEVNWTGWRLTFRKLSPLEGGRHKLTWWTEDFDAVILAIGRYNAAYIPHIKGLEAWANKWPQSIQHSREYRRPEYLTNKTVLIIGAATSGSEISRECSRSAKKIYQSIRSHKNTKSPFRWDYLLSRIPANVSLISEIAEFRPPTDSAITSGEVKLLNGTVLSGFDHIIFATGFQYTFPFLPQYHDSSLGPNDTAKEGPQPLVTDGTHIRSLHLDILYIEEPTLGFINLDKGFQTFGWSEFVALALARVWSGKAHLPSTEEMWRLYWKRVEERGGHGKNLQYAGATIAERTMRFFVGWLNTEAWKYGGRLIEPLPQDQALIRRYWSDARFNGSLLFDRYVPYGIRSEATALQREDAVFDNDW